MSCESKDQPLIVILIGVSGVGKTTIGRLLAVELGWPFYDADDFHSAANVTRMAGGHALTDEERMPWLASIREKIEDHLVRGEPAVFACSALRAAYRQVLKRSGEAICFVHLRGEMNLVRQRIKKRRDHFMPDYLLESQFNTLEEPEDVLTIDIAHEPATIVRQLAEALSH